MRRGYAERFEAQKRAQQNGEAIFQLIDNSCFDRSAPAISVIVTLYNYRAYIQQCLKSLEDSKTAAIPGGIEIVIVNDASTDDSLTTGDWRGKTHATPFVLSTNGSIRGWQMRATSAFNWRAHLMLSSWTQITWFFPARSSSYTQRLLETIPQLFTRCSVVFKALTTIGKDSFRISIGTHRCWSSIPTLTRWRCLIEGNSSKSADMILSCINSAGSDGRTMTYGCELRRQIRVSFLPNVLCLYRHHERSMSNTTNLFDRELVAHLIEKYHSLVETYPPKNRILGVNRSRLRASA